MNLRTLCLAIAAAASLVACASPSADLDKLCPIAESIQKDASIAPELKHARFIVQAGNTMRSRDMQKIVNALNMTDDGKMRYALLKQGALEIGRPGYTCAAYEQIASAK